MSNKVNIIWFRQDLRRADNPALVAAHRAGSAVLPLYILDDETAGDWRMGAASRVWLHHSLRALRESLDGHLHLARGKAEDILPALVKKTGAGGVYWNRCYEPWRIARDKRIKDALREDGITVESFNGSLLWEPWDKAILKNDGTPYKVFTPFFTRGCLGAPPPRTPLPAPARLACADAPGSLPIEKLDLLPPGREGGWETPIVKDWPIGEAGAQKRLHAFIDDGLKGYKQGRNIPAQEHVSRLSPHLHFGELSPNQVWHAVRHAGEQHHWTQDSDNFSSELGWREFSYSLLYNHPDIKWKNLQPRFDDFPWQTHPTKELAAWQQGRTGYPIVDAAMRELWQTGYMHNRCRMIVGSFLVKNLLIHWRRGEEWFWDCLFDADAANNTASWQWIAGCGADAAPYFRVFNPVLQGEKFDPGGTYVRRFVPELAAMPDKYLHKPWTAPKDLRAQCDYPDPIVELEGSRNRALDAFKETKA